MNQWFLRFLLCLLIVIPCRVTTLVSNETEPISRRTGNVLRNILGVETYKHHIVTSRLDKGFGRVVYGWIQDLLRSVAGKTGLRKSGTFLQQPLPPTTPFPCRKYGHRSVVVPNSVHELRPGDIDIVAAMGDSETAATSANSVSYLEVVDNRGLSFSIGGYGNFRTHLTIPNILKEFNPRLFGYALGDSYNKDRDAQFNVAEVIATTSDMPFMAYNLIRRMRLDRRVDMKNHWKLITIMIGTNDFCQDICYQKDATLWMNREQEQNIIETLRIIRDKIPRTFVNLVTEPAVSLILSMDRLRNLPMPCSIGRTMACSCFEGTKFSQQRDLYIALEQNYQRIFGRVARLPEFHRKDFTVVHQPFGLNASVFRDSRTADISIMAIDCIHFSQKGHAVLANALWNNMMQPESQKAIGLKPLYQEFECPTEDNPYLRTYYNSEEDTTVRTW